MIRFDLVPGPDDQFLPVPKVNWLLYSCLPHKHFLSPETTFIRVRYLLFVNVGLVLTHVGSDAYPSLSPR